MGARCGCAAAEQGPLQPRQSACGWGISMGINSMTRLCIAMIMAKPTCSSKGVIHLGLATAEGAQQ